VSLPLASGTSSPLGYVYSRGNAATAPVLGSTVKIVRDGRCTVASLPSEEELQLGTPAHLGDPAVLEQIRDEDPGVAGGEKATATDALDDEMPRLGWIVTLALLVLVTIVRLAMFVSSG
jgi:hypothetical protein